MGKRPKRKIVLFLVEGKSDREALSIAISELYDRIDPNIEVFFPVIRDEEKEKGGDITSTVYTDKHGKDHWIHPERIEDAIYTLFLEDFFDKEKILPKDIAAIVQIVDTDGAYVSDDKVIFDENLSKDDKPVYKETGIRCVNAEHIKKRNEQKSKNLTHLSSIKTIKVKQKTVPYSIYYFSCNLDHFLHNDANLEHSLKIKRAKEFAGEYIDKTEAFVKCINDNPGTVQDMDYAQSWEFIKQDLNSLERHTNLNILLQELCK